MKNYLVVHGHFYQPPRENPWTGLISKQDSAIPFDNWNIKINKECYAANAASRILNSSGNITEISNNYSKMSFNFGPTLMKWIKSCAPSIYSRIIEADKISIENNNGHGNAIAQSYNHTILPLDSPDMVKTQIHWGIEDFISHFSRKPEGIWLPETAVNNNVIDELITQHIKFIILSPWQAEAVCMQGQKNWRSLHNHPIPSHKVYKIVRPKGELAVFFYDPTLASGISFDHYLQNADQLQKILSGYFNDQDSSHLVSIATDGEIYGHHEPFGDMCLAALFNKISKDFEITNYGSYLEKFPPKDLVKLKSGEDDAGTSWSCTHGVSRWHKNCGCSTGGKEGWNQEWRNALRKSLNYLKKEALSVYAVKISELGGTDPFILRNSYIEVLTEKKTAEVFLKEHFPGKNKNEHAAALRLLEGQKYMMFMFTSCGWFFSEISGIEPVQNLKYAIRLIELYQHWTKSDLMEQLLVDLGEAKSNIPSKGTGRTIAETEVLNSSRTDAYTAAVLFISHVTQGDSRFGIFSVKEIKGDLRKNISGSNAEICIFNSELQTESSFTIEVKDLRNIIVTSMSGIVKNGKQEIFSAAVLPKEIRSALCRLFEESVVKDCMENHLNMLQKINKTLSVCSEMNSQPSAVIKQTAEVIFSQQIELILKDPQKMISNTDFKSLEELILQKNNHTLTLDNEGISRLFSRMIAYQTDCIKYEIASANTNYIKKLYRTAEKGNFKIEQTIPQNIIFSLISKFKDRFFEEIENKNFNAFSNMRHLISLGELFGIEVSSMKEKLLEP